jgi:Ca-activated chloride channel homolog
LNTEDFDNDKKDAGEFGSGQSVTALYEIVPTQVSSPYLKDKSINEKSVLNIDSLQQNFIPDEMAIVKFRYKKPQTDTSNLFITRLSDRHITIFECSDHMRFAASVAGFGMLLRRSAYKGDLNFNKVLKMAKSSLGVDTEGYRKEMLELVRLSKRLVNEQTIEEEESEMTGGNY